MPEHDAATLIAQLAGSLNDLAAADFDQAVLFLLGESGRVLKAENSNLAIGVRDGPITGPSPARWKLAWNIRYGPDSDAFGTTLGRWYSEAENLTRDGMAVGLARTAGSPRAFLRRDLVDDDAWARSPVHAMFDDLNIVDRLVASIPLGPDAELVLTFYRTSGQVSFEPKERLLAFQIATAIRPFLRRLALAYGIGKGREPLTPRERMVLQSLLTGAAEKEIASELKLTPMSLHQYVVAIYRKLGVSSRAQLMADFLAAGPR